MTRERITRDERRRGRNHGGERLAPGACCVGCGELIAPGADYLVTTWRTPAMLVSAFWHPYCYTTAHCADEDSHNVNTPCGTCGGYR